MKGLVQEILIFWFCIFLRLLVKHNALELPCCLFSSLRTSGLWGKSEQKKYFTDHRTGNTIQLVDVIKGNFSGLFFF